jgi:hypothetical protein
MRVVIFALLTAVLAAGPARAAYYEFTGTLSFKDPSPGGSARFLPEGVSVSGSGVAYSSAPQFRWIYGFGAVKGFTGSRTTNFGSTAGYTQRAFVSGFGPGSNSMHTCFPPSSAGCFTTNTVGQWWLHGKMGVPGLAERFGPGARNAAFPLTVGMSRGLGLGGTVMASSGTFPSVRFGTWRTITVSEPNVVIESHPAMGTVVYGDVTGMGFDTRTPSGMGTVQFVTPIRTVSQPVICPLPPCAPVPEKYGAVAVLTLTFAPEPGRAALLIAACLSLVLLGARRASR